MRSTLFTSIQTQKYHHCVRDDQKNRTAQSTTKRPRRKLNNPPESERPGGVTQALRANLRCCVVIETSYIAAHLIKGFSGQDVGFGSRALE
uniref:Uncharacterized protein n=1 Tax=Steinernema glaseri TaxID=37863 RepID=A0A1I8AUL9_9BILA